MSDQNLNGPTSEDPAPEPDAAQIRAEIEATRAEMSQTIDAIQDKLDPQHIKEEVIGKVHDATIGQAQHLAHLAGEKLHPATEKIEEAGKKLGEIAKPAVDTALEKSGDLKALAAQKPLVAGGLGVLVVALLVWLFPRDNAEKD